MDEGGFDLVILDGEATPTGGMGIAKQLKDEIADCPPILVLTGRPDDAWLASWSRAEAAVPHPIDPIRLGDAVVGAAARTRAVVGDTQIDWRSFLSEARQHGCRQLIATLTKIRGTRHKAR